MKKIMLVVSLATVSTFASAADLSKTCEDYFKAVDSFVEEVAKNSAMASQADMMKAQYDEAKKQMAALPADQQELGCKAGLDGLEQAKQMLPK